MPKKKRIASKHPKRKAKKAAVPKYEVVFGDEGVRPWFAKRQSKKKPVRSTSSESMEVMIGGQKAKPLPIGVDSSGKVGLIDQTGEKSNGPTEP